MTNKLFLLGLAGVAATTFAAVAPSNAAPTIDGNVTGTSVQNVNPLSSSGSASGNGSANASGAPTTSASVGLEAGVRPSAVVPGANISFVGGNTTSTAGPVTGTANIGGPGSFVRVKPGLAESIGNAGASITGGVGNINANTNSTVTATPLTGFGTQTSTASFRQAQGVGN